VAELLVVTDYFVLATGGNDRMVGAIVDEVEHQMLEKARMKPIGREGEAERRWVLLDYGDVVVHVFQPSERDFYRLEKLWADAPQLDLPPEVVNASRPASEDADEGEAGQS
jgi:ribosome-associated protein